VSTVERRQGIKIAAPEEISFENGWISQSLFLTLPNIQMDNDYASYLKNLIR
jgi:glucose-1-phosphate thymidylyltransferase